MSLDGSPEITPSLQQAFEAFNVSAQKLSTAYAELEERFRNVNQELAETNLRLRQHLEEKQRLHHYLESILNSMGTGVVVFDLEGKISLFNHSTEQLTGLEAAEVMDQPCKMVFGDESYCAPQVSYQHDVTPSWLPADRGIPLDVRTDLVKDVEGNLLGILLLMEDISERKHLEEQVRRTNTLTALGKMAAEVVHEIRNPLAAMQIYARLLQQDLEGQNKHLADDIMAAIHSLELISGNMLSLTRPVSPRFRQVNLAQVIESALEFSVYALEENEIDLVCDYPQEGLICDVDSEQLKQVTLNLLLNAIQAMPSGGRLVIHIAKSDPKHLTWKISDTGCGIPKENIERIFTPFFSSKPSGTGLGLHTVERILQAHRASIEVLSEVSKGTEFTIRLPIQQI